MNDEEAYVDVFQVGVEFATEDEKT